MVTITTVEEMMMMQMMMMLLMMMMEMMMMDMSMSYVVSYLIDKPCRICQCETHLCQFFVTPFYLVNMVLKARS